METKNNLMVSPKIIGIISVIFLIFGAFQIKAIISPQINPSTINLPIICSFSGPENSPDLLRLSEFLVTGPSNPKVGDSITVSFKLQNYGQYDLNLGSKGIFVAGKNPDNSDASFGFTRQNTTFKVSETISVSATKVLDKVGTWKIWPSYHLTFAGAPDKFGPEEWHACTIQVSPTIQDSDQDGIPDDKDNCPQRPNSKQEDVDKDGIGDVCDSCDDRDLDGDKIKNCLDKCPTDAENYNNYQDEDGCPDEKPLEVKDSDGDGILDDKDKCPKEKETFNGYQDEDGCPDEKPKEEIKDTDQDGIPDDKDKCPKEKETFNNYQDDDGCPDKVAEGAKKPEKDNTAPTINITKNPEQPKLGDNVEIVVKASDLSGVDLIILYLDGQEKKKCFGDSCSYITPPITQMPEIGALVLDGANNVEVSGRVPSDRQESWWFHDDDGDGIENIRDNCRQRGNPDQADQDNDGVGDVCDSCNPYSYCDGHPDNIFSGACPWWTYAFDFVSRDGCGCADLDGFNPFNQSYVVKERIEENRLYRAGSPSQPVTRCDVMSRCDSPSYDTCQGNRVIENYCSSAGPATSSIECPYGCRGGACICSDTDGGEDYYNRGSIEGQWDECLDSNRLKELTCGEIRNGRIIPKEKIVNCPYGCQNGACVCQDSDGGKNYNQMGSVGTLRDYCSCENCPDNRTLHEYYIESKAENSCQVRSEAHTCEGLCRGGQCLPPTCSDGVKNQGEEDIDCGGPCTPCGYVAVKGRILYQEADGNGRPILDSSGNPIFKPARFLKFEIMIPTLVYMSDCVNPDCSEIVTYSIIEEKGHGPYLTDHLGYFSQTFPRNIIAGDIHLKIGGEDMYGGGFNYAVKIARDFDWCNEYVSWNSNEVPIPERGDIDFGELRIGKDSNLEFTGVWKETYITWVCDGGRHDLPGGSVYLNIADAILTAREYADGKRGDDDIIPKVSVEYPDASTRICGDVSCYELSSDQIHLRQENGFDDGTIIHEYGHFLQDKISQNDWCVRNCDHTFCSDKDDTEFAWQEGFAEYLGTIIPSHHQDFSDPQFLSGPNIWYQDAETIPCKDNAGNFKSRKTMEATVVNVLWDLADDSTFPGTTTEDFDVISGMETLIFKIFDSQLDNAIDAPDLCELIREGWDCRDDVMTEGVINYSGTRRRAINQLLRHYNVNCDRGCGMDNNP
jgi:hypothetical protein